MGFSEKVRLWVAEKALAGVGGAGGVGQGILAGVLNPSAGSAGAFPRRGTKEILEFFTTNPLLYMVGNKIGELSASQNWRLFQPTSKANKKDLVQLKFADERTRKRELHVMLDRNQAKEVEDHPFLGMIRHGNRFMVGRNIRKIQQVYFDLVGEVFLVYERNKAGVPFEWFPIVPTDVEALPTVDNPVFRVKFGAVTHEIPEGEIFCLKDLDPLKPYERGFGLGRVVGDELEIDEYSSKYIRNFFRQGATPPLVISSPDLSPRVKAKAEANWQAANMGFRNSWIPYFMNAPEGTQLTELNSSFKDRQIVEVRKYERDFILQVYGISPEIFGILTNSNRSTIIEARNLLAEGVLIPRLETWREAYQERLIPQYDENLLVDYDDPRPKDETLELSAARNARFALTVNEHRAKAGLPPLDGEDGQWIIVEGGMDPFRDYEDLRATREKEREDQLTIATSNQQGGKQAPN